MGESSLFKLGFGFPVKFGTVLEPNFIVEGVELVSQLMCCSFLHCILCLGGTFVCGLQWIRT